MTSPKHESLSQTIIEFYEKLNSWEVAVIKSGAFSVSQIHTVEILGHHGSLKMKDLAARIGISTGTLTVNVDALVRNGLVRRKPNDEDRRSFLVELTTKGWRLFAKHERDHDCLTDQLTAGLGKNEVIELDRLLKKLNAEF